MTISYQANGSVQLSTKGRTVSLGEEVRIEDYAVPGAGEYDVATIQCEAYASAKGTVYFLHAEDLTVTFLSNLIGEVTKMDGASATSILVVELRSDADEDQLKPILKGLEPSYVFLIGGGATPEFAQKLGLTPYEGSTLKVSRSSLPLEGTFLVLNK